MVDQIEKGKSGEKKIPLVEKTQVKKKQPGVVGTVQCKKCSVNSLVVLVFFCRRSLEGFMVFPDQYKRHSIS